MFSPPAFLSPSHICLCCSCQLSYGWCCWRKVLYHRWWITQGQTQQACFLCCFFPALPLSPSFWFSPWFASNGNPHSVARAGGVGERFPPFTERREKDGSGGLEDTRQGGRKTWVKDIISGAGEEGALKKDGQAHAVFPTASVPWSDSES